MLSAFGMYGKSEIYIGIGQSGCFRLLRYRLRHAYRIVSYRHRIKAQDGAGLAPSCAFVLIWPKY